MFCCTSGTNSAQLDMAFGLVKKAHAGQLIYSCSTFQPFSCESWPKPINKAVYWFFLPVSTAAYVIILDVYLEWIYKQHWFGKRKKTTDCKGEGRASYTRMYFGVINSIVIGSVLVTKQRKCKRRKCYVKYNDMFCSINKILQFLKFLLYRGPEWDFSTVRGSKQFAPLDPRLPLHIIACWCYDNLWGWRSWTSS